MRGLHVAVLVGVRRGTRRQKVGRVKHVRCVWKKAHFVCSCHLPSAEDCLSMYSDCCPFILLQVIKIKLNLSSFHNIHSKQRAVCAKKSLNY